MITLGLVLKIFLFIYLSIAFVIRGRTGHGGLFGVRKPGADRRPHRLRRAADLRLPERHHDLLPGYVRPAAGIRRRHASIREKV